MTVMPHTTYQTVEMRTRVVIHQTQRVKHWNTCYISITTQGMNLDWRLSPLNPSPLINKLW